MPKSIIIIGAGIAGLSAGCYGRMNGYETRIFEMHDKPGGLCTSWKRGGYTFDGGLAGQVEAVDVATPMTYERYTGNWRGSFEGWLLATETTGMMIGKGLPKTLPGLADFHMIGQWTTLGGGLPPAAKDGRDVIKTICRVDGKSFLTS